MVQEVTVAFLYQLRQRRLHRRGAAMVAALVTLLVVGMISAALVTSVAAHQRQLRAQQQRLQALWLAESAAGRAAAQLAAAADYEGETWQASVERADGGKTGLAVIRVQPVPGFSDLRQVTVDAYYPDDPVHRVRHQKKLQLLIINDSGEMR